MGEAIRIATENMAEESTKVEYLRDKLLNGLMEKIPECKQNTPKSNKRLPGIANLSLKYIEGESILLMMDIKGICASSGSACTSGSLDPSHVLLALGLDHGTAHGSIRFSLDRFNTEEEVDYILEELPKIAERLREMSPLWNRK